MLSQQNGMLGRQFSEARHISTDVRKLVDVLEVVACLGRIPLSVVGAYGNTADPGLRSNIIAKGT